MILSKMDVSENPLQPGLSWRTWTSEKLGSLNSKFEEIDFNVNHRQDHEMQKFRLETCKPSDRGEEAEISDGLITHNELKSRLRHLQLQLSSVLALMRSKSEASEIVQETTNNSDRLQKHYDAWEFQENEIMAAKDMLRSIRAKLSVLEGKMALAKQVMLKRLLKKGRNKIKPPKELYNIFPTLVWFGLIMQMKFFWLALSMVGPSRGGWRGLVLGYSSCTSSCIPEDTRFADLIAMAFPSGRID